MCGRFTLSHDAQTIAQTILNPRMVKVPASFKLSAHYNIAPTQDIVAILNQEEPQLDFLRWGLIPSWAKEESIGSKMINARAETLAEKPSFKRLLHSKRCLIVADGFYEWSQEAGSKHKTPMYITLEDQEPFAFAGLWDVWKDSTGQAVRTCTIITTEPNELMQSIHNRMPVLLPREARDAWIDPRMHDEQALLHLLKPYPSSAMVARPVSRLVNDPRNDSVEVLA
ncbi:SOS response-associated peptidase [Tengunoibacter tsumagoiensis]|uniref:Abasic site processing protein n=1 Tax=Tengunoibacter tsumagoiensis TaxID=2014871 RepID=A0A401ZW52_9CHLR|nr:SOS response-associated peptidase [Tengunoibacter tsumagoiensis]GCE10954.1 DUF159 family protein [Tengunoibacter tsumagoiensis]